MRRFSFKAIPLEVEPKGWVDNAIKVT